MPTLTTWGGVRFAWISPQALGLAGLVAIAGLGFVVIEKRAVEPVLPPRLFRDREFVLISIAGAALGFAMIGILTFVPLFQQPPGVVAAALAVFGVGMGAMMQASFVFAIGRAQPHDRGVASATTTLVRSLGGALGVAAGGALFAARVGPSDGAAHLDAAGVASGSAAVFLLCAGAGMIVLVTALFVRDTPEREAATILPRRE